MTDVRGIKKKRPKSKREPTSDDEDLLIGDENPKDQCQSANPIEDEQKNEEMLDDEETDELQNEGNDTTSTEQEYVKLRQELSELSFEDLQKLKDKIGLKQFNEIYYGSSKNKKSRPTDDKKRTFKRVNKNRPVEMSSKRPVPRLGSSLVVKKQVMRDPRFDDLSGEYNEAIFNKSYGFLNDVKLREKKTLLKQLKIEKDPEKKKKINSLVIRLSQQEDIEKQKEEKKERDKKLRTEEKELVKDGKKPFYWKKSEKKKLELAEKFRELKKSGKVESYLGKKRKRTAAKERRKLPNKGQF